MPPKKNEPPEFKPSTVKKLVVGIAAGLHFKWPYPIMMITGDGNIFSVDAVVQWEINL